MSATNFPDSTLRHNFFHLYADVFWFGVLAGSAMAFLAVYLSRIHASGLQIGLLTAGPAAVNLLISLPAGRWLQGRQLVRASFRASLGQRLAYVLLIPLPWLFPESFQVWMVLLLYVLMSWPGTILAIAFNALFAELVPTEWRGEVVGRRNALLAISITGTSLLCGQLLDRIVFPLDYQIVFAIGAAGALMSSYHIWRLLPPERMAPVALPARPHPARSRTISFPLPVRFPFHAGLRFSRPAGEPLLRLDLLRGPFGPFMAAYLVLYLVQYVPFPLFPLFLVQELRLSDGEISLGNVLFYAVMLLVSLRLKGASARYGHRRVLLASALFFGAYPLLIGLASDARLYWLSSLMGGGIWALMGGALLNRLMERSPEGDLPAHMALHNLVLNVGILAGSLIGPAMGSALGLRESLLVAAGLRTLGALVLWLWG